MNSRDRLVTNHDTNSLYYILRLVRLVITLGDHQPQLIQNEIEELFTKQVNNLDWNQLSYVVGIEDLRRVVFYFMDHGAATASILQHRLDLSSRKVYLYLKKLVSLKLVEPAVRIQKESPSKGGPRATVYKVLDATIDQVHDAIKIHRRLLSPKYRVAEEMAQLLLDEYLEPRGIIEISYREILVFLKEKRVTFVVADVAHLAAQYLHEKGIKVWR